MADHDRPDPEHHRPRGLDDKTVEAIGRLTEALETCERARGHLYAFHQLTGESDFKLGDAADQLRDAGHPALADQIERDLVGRNVLPGRWTFQVVEEYDDGYWRPFRELEQRARDDLTEGRRHLAEAELKDGRRTRGRSGHEANPDS